MDTTHAQQPGSLAAPTGSHLLMLRAFLVSQYQKALSEREIDGMPQHFKDKTAAKIETLKLVISQFDQAFYTHRSTLVKALNAGLQAAAECKLNATYHIRVMNEALASLGDENNAKA